MNINSYHASEFELSDLRIKFKTVIPIPILYYSQGLVLEKGNHGVGEVEGVYIYILESPFPTWNIYHAELEPSSRLLS